MGGTAKSRGVKHHEQFRTDDARRGASAAAAVRRTVPGGSADLGRTAGWTPPASQPEPAWTPTWTPPPAPQESGSTPGWRSRLESGRTPRRHRKPAGAATGTPHRRQAVGPRAPPSAPTGAQAAPGLGMLAAALALAVASAGVGAAAGAAVAHSGPSTSATADRNPAVVPTTPTTPGTGSGTTPGSGSSSGGFGSGTYGSGGFGSGGFGSGSDGSSSGSGAGSAGTGSSSAGTPTSAAAAAIAAKVDPAVVDITTTLGYQSAKAAGTGMVITSSGEVLTNNHVIDGATSITAQIAGAGTIYNAKVIGTDPTQDVALIQLEGVSGMKTVTIGSATKVSVGTPAVAIGNALDLPGPPSVTSGSITAVNQSITSVTRAGATPRT